MATVAEDNFSFLFFLFDTSVLPKPKGYKNAKEMELALTQPNAMNQILVGIQYDDNMASKLIYLFILLFLFIYCVHTYIHMSTNIYLFPLFGCQFYEYLSLKIVYIVVFYLRCYGMAR